MIGSALVELCGCQLELLDRLFALSAPGEGPARELPTAGSVEARPLCTRLLRR